MKPGESGQARSSFVGALSLGQPISIILVDDDPDEHLLFREDLHDAGVVFDFVAFTRADDALDHLRNRHVHPVLILTDLSLAGDAALTLIEASQDHLHGGAVGCYSGTHNPEMEDRCRALGASFYIVKPVTRDAIVEIAHLAEAIRVRPHEDGKVAFVAG